MSWHLKVVDSEDDSGDHIELSSKQLYDNLELLNEEIAVVNSKVNKAKKKLMQLEIKHQKKVAEAIEATRKYRNAKYEADSVKLKINILRTNLVSLESSMKALFPLELQLRTRIKDEFNRRVLFVEEYEKQMQNLKNCFINDKRINVSALTGDELDAELNASRMRLEFLLKETTRLRQSKETEKVSDKVHLISDLKTTLRLLKKSVLYNTESEKQ